MNRIILQKVYYLPKVLEPGILYVSLKYGIAGHLCPCGCGNKIITPLGKNEWAYKEVHGKPSLYPSIGNWQLPCQSHYWICKGSIVWSNQWSKNDINIAYSKEMSQRKSYYRKREEKILRHSKIKSIFRSTIYQLISHLKR